MSTPRPTPETDEFWLQIDDSEFDTTQIVNKLRQFEHERDDARNQLHRICKDGFDMQDTIGLEPADDYVLRQVEKMKGGVAHLDDVISLIERCSIDETPGDYHDTLSAAKAALAKLQPFITP